LINAEKDIFVVLNFYQIIQIFAVD